MWYLLIYLSRYFEQETAKGYFRSLSQAVTCNYHSNHSETIPLNALPKDTTKELSAECQAKEVVITSFLKSSWSDSATA